MSLAILLATSLGWSSDPFKKANRDLQIRNEKVTLNHLVWNIYRSMNGLNHQHVQVPKMEESSPVHSHTQILLDTLIHHGCVTKKLVSYIYIYICIYYKYIFIYIYICTIFAIVPSSDQDIFWDLDGSLTGTANSYTSWADTRLGPFGQGIVECTPTNVPRKLGSKVRISGLPPRNTPFISR